jgi:hypothetical protein
MSSNSSTHTAAVRTRKFVVWGAVIGALVGLVAFLAKVAIEGSKYGSNWLWALVIPLAAVAGLALGLVFSALGQDDDN